MYEVLCSRGLKGDFGAVCERPDRRRVSENRNRDKLQKEYRVHSKVYRPTERQLCRTRKVPIHFTLQTFLRYTRMLLYLIKTGFTIAAGVWWDCFDICISERQVLSARVHLTPVFFLQIRGRFVCRIPEKTGMLIRIKVFLSNVTLKKHYYICYTVMFLVVAHLVYWWPLVLGKSFIYNVDGWDQHYKALLYYSRYLREIVRVFIFEHRIAIPDWDFYIGEGSDIINTLHYYVIGDPFALFSLFIPARFIHFYFSFSCILRLYLSGLFFSVLAFETGIRNRYGVLAGALSYCFCYWALFNSVRHPYFLNPLIFFPLIILGAEKIINNKRPYIFIASVALSAASNFYFFYMIVILTAIYILIRLFFLYRESIKSGLKVLARIALFSLTGVSISGIIFIPVFFIFLSDSRLSNSQPFHFFYSLDYYSEMPAILLTGAMNRWLCMGYNALVIVSLFSFFSRRKGSAFLRTLCIVSGIIILFPVCGRILNGMSYATNRWIWSLALLCSYILAKEWEQLLSLDAADIKKIIICCVSLFIIALGSSKSRTAASFSSIVLLFITIIVLTSKTCIKNEYRRKQITLLFITCFSISNIAFWFMSPNEGNYVSELIENRNVIQNGSDKVNMIIKALAEGVYPRYTMGRNMSRNYNMIDQVSNTQYYWTLSNPYLNQYRKDIEVQEQDYYNFYGYDSRTAPLALSSVDYYYDKKMEGNELPYGYSMAQNYEDQEGSKGNSCYIYKNDYSLPLGYCYETYIDHNKYESLDPVQKQEVQLDAVYIKEAPELIPSYSEELPDFSIPYTLVCNGEDIIRSEEGFITTTHETTATLTFCGKYSAETYIRFSGFDFRATSEYDLYSDNSIVDPLNIYDNTVLNKLPSDDRASVLYKKLYWRSSKDVSLKAESSFGRVNVLDYKPEDAVFSNDRHDYILNLGYQKEPVTSITITFPLRGVYTIKDIQVFCIPMDDYPDKIEKLKENTLQNISMGIDSVSGDITLDKTMFLVMAIPFSKGWKAYIDGVCTPVMTANERHLGIIVPEGYHEILFTYSTPYKYQGVWFSLAGTIIFIITIVFTERKRRRDRNEVLLQKV